MSAYLKTAARPVLSVADGTALRAEPSNRLGTGQLAILSGAGATFLHIVRYNPASTGVDDGATFWKPNDVLLTDPGRWEILGSDGAVADTYVKRDAAGAIAGVGAGGSDFAAAVARVNWATGNDPVPSVLCGFSVDRGAAAGVERDRAAVLWDEAAGTMNVAFSTTNDTVLSTYIPVVAGGFYSTGGGASGFLRLRQDEAITTKVGANTWELAVGTSAGNATFGSSAWTTASLDANGDVDVISRAADVTVRGAHFYVYDASGVTQLLDASVGGAYLNVVGRLRAYNGATLVFDADVGSGVVQANGALRAYDPTGTTKYFDASSTEVLALKTGVLTGTVVGFAVRNTSPATVSDTVQRSPTTEREAHAWISGADVKFLFRDYLVPTTSTTYRYVFERSLDGGSSWSEAMRITNSTPTQFVGAVLASSGFALSSNGGFFYDADNSGMFRGGTGELQLLNRATTVGFLFRSPVTSAGVPAFRVYANGATRGEDEDLIEFGDVAAGFVQRATVRGDGTWNGPAWRGASAVAKTANYTAKPREIIYLDPSGGVFDLTLPTAVGIAGQQVKAVMVTLSANVVTLLTTSGQTISGAASGALTAGNATTLEVLTFTSNGANWWFERAEAV